eukprot:5135651-Amphidinium_carterae.1
MARNTASQPQEHRAAFDMRSIGEGQLLEQSEDSPQGPQLWPASTDSHRSSSLREVAISASDRSSEKL